MSDLVSRRCKPCEGGVDKLNTEQIDMLKPQLQSGWQVVDSHHLERRYSFDNYFHTTAFVNAAVYVAHAEDHHPEIIFGYDECTIRYWTHAVDGLTDNDFICAAKTDALLPSE